MDDLSGRLAHAAGLGDDDKPFIQNGVRSFAGIRTPVIPGDVALEPFLQGSGGHRTLLERGYAGRVPSGPPKFPSRCSSLRVDRMWRGEAYELPISTPARNTSIPPTMTWRNESQKLMAKYRLRMNAIVTSSMPTTK